MPSQQSQDPITAAQDWLLQNLQRAWHTFLASDPGQGLGPPVTAQELSLWQSASSR